MTTLAQLELIFAVRHCGPAIDPACSRAIENRIIDALQRKNLTALHGCADDVASHFNREVADRVVPHELELMRHASGNDEDVAASDRTCGTADDGAAPMLTRGCELASVDPSTDEQRCVPGFDNRDVNPAVVLLRDA